GLGQDVTLRHVLEAALPFVAPTFAQQPLTEARLRMTMGSSFFCLGDAGLAKQQYERARELLALHRGPAHPETLQCLNDLALSYGALGRHADALKLQEQTLALQKGKLNSDDADILRSMHNLAASYYALARFADALKLFQDTLARRKVALGP